MLFLGNIPGLVETGILTGPVFLLGVGLEGLANAVQYIATIPGHVCLPGPRSWWLSGYYLLLLPISLIPVGRPAWRWSVRMWGGWWLIGFLCLLLPTSTTPHAVPCSPWDMGAVLLEFPSGHTLLYDCGGMGDPQHIAKTVQTALLQRGTNRIDQLFLSHADSDHFNGAIHLLRNLNVREICVTADFITRTSPGSRNSLQPPTMLIFP